MAILDSSATGRLTRDSSAWFDPSLDWTDAAWQRFKQVTGGYATFWAYWPGNYSTEYVWLGAASGTALILEHFDGVATYLDTSPITLGFDWHYRTVRYTAASHSLELLIDGVLIDTLTADLDGFAPQSVDSLLNDGFSADDITEIADHRRWQAALSDGAIAAEMISSTPVLSTGLLSNTAFATTSDLTDTVGAHHWTATGGLTTVTGPLTAYIAVGALMFAVLSPDCFSAFASPTGVELDAPVNNPNHCPFGGPEEGILQLDDGTICLTNFKNQGQATFAADLTPIGYDTSFDLYGIASNYTDAFYGIQQGIGAFVFIQKYDTSCVAGTSWSLGIGTSGSRYGLGMAPDESVAYYAQSTGAGSDTVHRRDLVGASTTTFATEASHAIAFRGGIVVLRNGEVLIAWDGTSSYVKHYSTAAAVLHTYTLPGSPFCLTPALDDSTFWVSYFSGPAVGFRHVRVSDGALLADFTLGDGGVTGYQWDAPFCVIRTAIGTNPATPPAGPFLAHILDSQTNNYRDIVLGGGSLPVLAMWNGSDWIVIGK